MNTIKLKDVQVVLLENELMLAVGDKTISGESAKEAVPFACTPTVERYSEREREAYKIYTTSCLYHIIQNGGKELTKGQREFLQKLRQKYVNDENKIKSEANAEMTVSSLLRIERALEENSTPAQKSAILAKHEERYL